MKQFAKWFLLGIAIAAVAFLLFSSLILVSVAVAQETPTDKEEPYDPDNLGPGEVACGRPGSTKAPPCQCRDHRERMQEEESSKCRELKDIKARVECYARVPHCPPVRDAENPEYNTETGEPMPPQCKRTCRKARCECCKT